MRTDMEKYFSGEKLWGDDFSPSQIEEWFASEAEGYFNLTQAGNYSYGYHALNMRHGYSLLPKNIRFNRVLGVGSAYGDELEPVINRSDSITILEPSDGFQSTMIKGVPVSYEKPVPSGIAPFASNSFDLITCFGVIHHIPNVSTVINEFYRILNPEGYLILREPVISMGDWRKPRAGLTKNERGIPSNFLRTAILKAGFSIISERNCMFSLMSRFRYFVSGAVYNNSILTALDHFISSLPLWSTTYHPRNALQKLRPTAVFYVVQKPA